MSAVRLSNFIRLTLIPFSGVLLSENLSDARCIGTLEISGCFFGRFLNVGTLGVVAGSQPSANVFESVYCGVTTGLLCDPFDVVS